MQRQVACLAHAIVGTVAMSAIAWVSCGPRAATTADESLRGGVCFKDPMASARVACPGPPCQPAFTSVTWSGPIGTQYIIAMGVAGAACSPLDQEPTGCTDDEYLAPCQ
jgi:hypothetical protein